MESQQKALISLGVLLAGGLIAAAGLVSRTIYDVRALSDTFSVTGSARQRVTSDSVKWSASFTRTSLAADLKGGYSKMKEDEKVVQAFLVEKGVAADSVTISPVMMSDIYKQDPNAPREFTLRQQVEVRSGDVAKITAIAKDLSPLIDKGLLFSSDYLEYTYSKLPELRVSLLGAAVTDARARATEIAGSAGMNTGALRSATAGVVQVLPVGSTEVSDYGAYDTQSIEKEVMVTVKAVFGVK